MTMISGLRWAALGACVVVLSAAGPRAAVGESARPPLWLAQAPPRVIGCEITIDVGKTVDCLRDAVAREVRKAERETRRAAESEIGKLQSQLASAEKAAALELAKAKAKAEKAAEMQVRHAQAQLAAAQKQAAELQQQLASSLFVAQLAWQRALLVEIKKQETLFRCLEAGNVDIGKLIQEFATNPGSFAQARAQEVIRTATVTFPGTVTSELDQLGRGLNASGADRTVLIRRGTDTMMRIAEQMPAGRCLVQAVPPPLRAQIEATLGATLNEAERQARSLMNDRILPAVRAGLATQLRGGFESIVKVVPSPVPTVNQELERRVPFLQGLTLTEREMRAVARGVLLERQYDVTFRAGSEAIEILARAVAAPAADPTALDQARKRVEATLRSAPDYDQLYAAIGVELLRAIGHKYVDSGRPGHGGFLLNQGFSLLQLSMGTTQNLTEALCGLIPEVGGAICAYVLQGMITVWNGAIVPQLQHEMAQLLHVAMDTSMDRVRGDLARGVKLADVRARLGPADAVIAAIPSEALLAAWANGFIDNDIKAIDRFTGSVLSLTGATAQRR